MASEVHCRHQNGIAVLTLDRPVANALAPEMRADLSHRIDEASADPGVRGLVLHGAGNGFSSGVDITEYQGRLGEPWVGELCNRIELCPKPVVAALHGAALGAGFELALAAHARVAAKDTRVALPEVSLELIPGGGATQRAPRLVGAQVALEFMLSGQVAAAGDPRIRHFFDRITGADPLEEAIALAGSMAQSGRWVRTRDQMRGLSDPEGYQKAVAAVAEKIGGRSGAQADIVRCIEAAQLLPFERGLAYERVVFEERIHSEGARGQRHIFAAERRAAIMPEVAQGAATEVRRVALLGSSQIMPELAIAFLDVGRQVHLASADPGAVRAIAGRIRRVYDVAVSRGRLKAEARDERLARLAMRTDHAAVAGVDAVFECGGAGPATDRPDMKAGAIRVVLDGSGQAAAGGALECRVYRPAHSRQLVELIVPPGGPAPEGVATLVRMFSSMNRTVVRCAGGVGSAGLMMANALYRAALVLMASGHSPYDVDAAALRLGFAAGPFQMMDDEGLPNVLQVLRDRHRETDTATAGAEAILAERIERSAEGRVSGRGFYDYGPEGMRPIPALAERSPDPDADRITGKTGSERALLAAIVNAAARLLAQGAVQRATDLDVIMVRGYGFDRAHGGPLLQADLRGIFSVLQDMKTLTPLAPALWAPEPLVEDMVKNGKGFFGRVGQAA